MSDDPLKGQVALVTGASRGIGAAIARELASRGMKVIGTATTDDGAAKDHEALPAAGRPRRASTSTTPAGWKRPSTPSSSSTAACRCW
jgi:NAD(P)-dependent dehydrogenase (short-subunit alcohol dehydrogenase family)